MLTVFLCPKWLKAKNPSLRNSIQKEASDEEIAHLNSLGYNVYYYPNEPKVVENVEKFLEADAFHEFNLVFVDMDLKSKTYDNKEYFYTLIKEFPLKPLAVVDSGNGVHAYWKVETLSPVLYLELQRRLARHFNTDIAVAQLKQLMRLPLTMNTKEEGNFKPCSPLEGFGEENTHSWEAFNQVLAKITQEDKEYCTAHFNSTFGDRTTIQLEDYEIPFKFHQLLKTDDYVKSLWMRENDKDRSSNDMALARILHDRGFNKEEIIKVLLNSDKVEDRTDRAKLSYATNTVNKIWETPSMRESVVAAPTLQNVLALMPSVDEILNSDSTAAYGVRLYCDESVDNTIHGFRAGQVIGMVGGSGIGKTTLALNMIKWFVERNPDKHHLFVGLEQNRKELSDRWSKIVGSDASMNGKIRILSNHQDNGPSLNLSLDDICAHIKNYEAITGFKLGAVVIDHIGLLSKNAKDTDVQGIMANSRKMKAIAEETKTLIIMQSQASREKAGIGDVELDKSAAYGSVYFESNCDYLMTLWQPLKRVYHLDAMTVIAYKFCKIRHKNQLKDIIREDIQYMLYFDPNTDSLRKLDLSEINSINTFWLEKAKVAREEADKKAVVVYRSAI